MSRMPSLVFIAGAGILVLATGLVAACAATEPADDARSLEGKTWHATEITGVTSVLTEEGSEATAIFSDGQVTGSGTVNRFRATYSTRPGNEITISQAASTQMAGPPDAMAQEQAYLAALHRAATYEVSGGSLLLLDDQGRTLVAYDEVQPTELTGTQWEAIAYNNGRGGLQSVALSSSISAVFGSDGTLAGNATINEYSTTYSVTGESQMTIDDQIRSTQMAGPEELMTQESAYLAALPKTATYTIEGDVLWLRDAEGAALAQFLAK
jgi:heat shock protein HslJ